MRSVAFQLVGPEILAEWKAPQRSVLAVFHFNFYTVGLRSRGTAVALTLTLIIVIAISELIVAMDGHTLGDVVKQ